MFEQFCDRQDLDFMQMRCGSRESIGINVYGVYKLRQATLTRVQITGVTPDSRQMSDN